jgi:hypothetical protein
VHVSDLLAGIFLRPSTSTEPAGLYAAGSIEYQVMMYDYGEHRIGNRCMRLRSYVSNGNVP